MVPPDEIRNINTDAADPNSLVFTDLLLTVASTTAATYVWSVSVDNGEYIYLTDKNWWVDIDNNTIKWIGHEGSQLLQASRDNPLPICPDITTIGNGVPAVRFITGDAGARIIEYVIVTNDGVMYTITQRETLTLPTDTKLAIASAIIESITLANVEAIAPICPQ